MHNSKTKALNEVHADSTPGIPNQNWQFDKLNALTASIVLVTVRDKLKA